MLSLSWDFGAWGWPQWTMLAGYCLVLLAAAILNGLPRTGKYQFGASLAVVVLEVLLLTAGGFFK